MNATIMRTIAASCALVIAMAATTSPAQKGADPAKAAFNRGSELFDKGDFVAAADAFREANRLKPSWKLFYNIGQAEAAGKRYGLALEAFERYLAEGGDEIAPDRNDEVIQEIKRLRELVGSAEIQAPEGATIFVDDIERGTAPLSGAIKLAAGVDHAIRAELDGAVLEARTIRVSGGDAIVVEVGMPKPAAATEGPSDGAGGAGEPTPAPEGPSPLKTWGWVALGVGAAVAVTGGVLGGMALSLDKQLQEDCQDNECLPAQHDDLEKRDQLGVASTALIAAGAAVAATGAVLLIVGYKRSETDGASGAADLSLVPSAGPGFAGAALLGRF